MNVATAKTQNFSSDRQLSLFRELNFVKFIKLLQLPSLRIGKMINFAAQNPITVKKQDILLINRFIDNCFYCCISKVMDY